MIVAPNPTGTHAPGWYAYLGAGPWTGGDPDKPTYEVVNGVRMEKKMGAAETGLANILNDALAQYLRENNLGRSYVGMEIELPVVGSKRKPDVAVVAEQTWPAARPIPPDAWWKVRPALAVEVVSPHELTHATLAKVQEYFAAGVGAVWRVQPHVRQVYCYSSPTAVRILTPADDLTGDPVVPGFRLPLAELFPPAADPQP